MTDWTGSTRKGPPVTAASLDPSVNDLLTVRVTSIGAVVRLAAAGEIDSSSAPSFRAELDAVLDGDVQELIVDLDAVSFLDSAGLSTLARAHRRAVERGIELRVLASGRAVMRPLQITGLWDLLQAEQVEPGAGSAD